MDGDRILLHEELEAKEIKLKSLFGHNNAYLFRIGMNSGSVPDTHSLKPILREIFESMDEFASTNARPYKELHMHSEEDSC
jgi:hypothetical protein